MSNGKNTDNDGDEETRLQNFVDLARVNLAFLVPALAAAVLATLLLQRLRNLSKHAQEVDVGMYRATMAGVFFTTLLDTGNIIAALTLERSSVAGILQITGASLHVLGAFHWRFTGLELLGLVVKHPAASISRLDGNARQNQNALLQTFNCCSVVIILGEATETTAVVLTLEEKFLIPAICLVAITAVLGTFLLCVSMGALDATRTGRMVTYTDVLNKRFPVVIVGEILFIGIVTIATIQDWRNIFLLFPEVPVDIIEHFVVSLSSRNNASPNSVTTASTNSTPNP